MKKTAEKKAIRAHLKKVVENVKFATEAIRSRIMVRLYGRYFYAKINRITPKGVWVSVPVGEHGRFVEKWIGNARTWTNENLDQFLEDWKKNHERRLRSEKTADIAKSENIPAFFGQEVA